MSDHTPGTSPEDIERYRVHFTRYGGWLQGADWPGRNVSPVVQALCTEVRRLRAELREARATIARLELTTLDGMAWWEKHDPAHADPNWGRTCACGGAVPAGSRYVHDCEAKVHKR